MPVTRHQSTVVTTRDALLDAAVDAFIAGDWVRTRMVDVATAAGVSRQTLYNEFGNKDQLAQAVTLRETERFLTGIREAVEQAHPHAPDAAVRAAVEFTLTAAADNPLIKAVLVDDAGLLPLLTTRADSVIALARADMVEVLTQRWPQLDAEQVGLAAEAVTRLTVSYLVLPADGEPATAEFVATRVSRLVDHLLQPPPEAAPAPKATKPKLLVTEVPS